MKISYLYIFLSIFFLPVSGQKEPVAVQDPLAEPILDKVAAMFSSDKAYHIEFRYEVESKADNYKVEDYGSVIIKGNNYKLKTEDGEVFYNGKRMWTYSPVNEEVYVSTPDPENMDQMMIVPFVLLNNYKNYFKYRLKGEKTANSKIFYEVDLYPIDLNSSYSIIRIQTEKSSGRLHSFSLQQKNGVTYNIFITELISNVKISPDTFEWNKNLYPKVLIIEL